MVMRRTNMKKTTRILWSKAYGVFICEKCNSLIHYNFGFDQCPYCGRTVTHTDKRGESL